MAKRLSVLSFLCCIGAASDDIPVTVKEGPKTIGTAKSLRWLELHGSPGVLEAHLEYAVIGKQGNHPPNQAQGLQHQEAVNRRCNGGQVRKELTKCLFSEPPTEPAMQGLSAT